MDEVTRTSIDVPPILKKRLNRLAKKSKNIGISAVTQAVIEKILPDFESGKFRVIPFAVSDEGQAEESSE